MREQESFNKVLPFMQPESKSTPFLHDYPISEKLQDKIVYGTHGDFMEYVKSRVYAHHYPVLKKYLKNHDVNREKRMSLEQNLFWWKVLYEASLEPKWTLLEEYIACSNALRDGQPLIKSWLREWNNIMPKFYYVGYKHNDRIFVLVDMLTQETVDVIVTDPLAVPAEKGEIVAGTLVPIGDALYFPIIDFYHFDLDAARYIAGHLDYYYDKYSEGGDSLIQAFIHVLSAMLQIEYRSQRGKGAEQNDKSF